MTTPARRATSHRPAEAAVPRRTTSRPVRTRAPESRGKNVKVNQNCQNVTDPDLAGRGQAQNETAVAIDPNNKNHVIASQNDYRRGDGNCYGAYSLDGGPQLERHDDPDGIHARHELRRQGAPVLAGGRRHVGRLGHEGQRVLQLPGVQPRRGRLAEPGSVERVLRLPLDRQQRRVVELPRAARSPSSNDTAGTGCCLLDKQYMTVDNHVGSPFQDRVYVTWTLYDGDGRRTSTRRTRATTPRTFSAPVLVSSDIPSCVYTYPIFGGGDDARQVQPELVLAAVHGARREPVRRVGELQHRDGGPGEPG